MWIDKISKDSDVVVSTRVRLARNLADYSFPHLMDNEEKKQVYEKIKSATKSKEYDIFNVKGIDKTTKYSLVEKYLVSKEFAMKGAGGIVINKDGSLVTMINEEDHLRIQAFGSGICAKKCYEEAIEFANKLEKKIGFAKSENYGYLTACPSNLGSGLRVSFMLHLPALAKIGLLPDLLAQATSIGILVRGLYGENTDSTGNIYQISNQKTLGVSDIDIINNIVAILTTIIEQERKAREVIKESSNLIKIEDEINRAYGILKNARLVSEEEAINLLSKLRFGTTIGVLDNVELENIQKLMIEIKTNTLKGVLKKEFSREEENVLRSEYIRKELM